MQVGVVEDPAEYPLAFLADPPPSRPIPATDTTHVGELGRAHGDRFTYQRVVLLADPVRLRTD